MSKCYRCTLQWEKKVKLFWCKLMVKKANSFLLHNHTVFSYYLSFPTIVINSVSKLLFTTGL